MKEPGPRGHAATLLPHQVRTPIAGHQARPGGRIAFQCNRAGSQDTLSMAAGGTDLRRLAVGSTSPPFLGGAVEIHVMNADGADDRVITRAGVVSPTSAGATDNESFDGRPHWAGRD